MTAEIARHRFQQINPDHSRHSWKNPLFQDNTYCMHTSPINITQIANSAQKMFDPKNSILISAESKLLEMKTRLICRICQIPKTFLCRRDWSPPACRSIESKRFRNWNPFWVSIELETWRVLLLSGIHFQENTQPVKSRFWLLFCEVLYNCKLFCLFLHQYHNNCCHRRNL